MDQDGTNAFPSTRLLAAATRLSQRAVCEHLNAAEQQGWLIRSVRGEGHGWRHHAYRIATPADVSTDDQQQREYGESAPPADVLTLTTRRADPDDIDVSTDGQSTIPSTLASPEEKTKTDDVRLVFEHWVTATRRDAGRTKLTNERRAKIAARLRSYSAAELCTAVDGVMLSDFHRAKPEYTDLVSCFGNDTKVETHIERAKKSPGAEPMDDIDRLQSELV